MTAPDHFWLVAGALMGGEWPERHLEWLKGQGISVIVNLTPMPYRDDRFRVYEIPIADGRAPAFDQIVHFCRLVDRELARTSRIYVHCVAGCGRTGTMLACYLAYRERLEAGEAVRQVRALRPCAIEGDAQEDAIADWGETLREAGYRLDRVAG
jgi:atypical dual specificity phosphatase